VKRFSFQERFRLKERDFFQLIFDNGARTATSAFIMWHINVLDRPELVKKGTKKIGIIVSRKLGNAVRRNRVKRLIRESFRLSRENIKDGFWMILYPKNGCGMESAAEAAYELKKIFDKAKISGNEK